VVTQVVSDTIDRCASSPQTRRSFDKVNLKNLKKKLVEQICFLGGGGCEYTGDGMKLVHKGLDITQSEFYGLVDILRDSLNQAGVAEGAKNELLQLLAPMKREIVTK
jgi:hemoglobin